MLTLKNWRLEVPDCGRSIGYEGENRAFRLEIETDIDPEWTCQLDMEYSSGATAALPLTLENGVLWAELTRPYLAIPGPVSVTVRAQNGDTVKKSSTAALFIGEAAGDGGDILPPQPDEYDLLLAELGKKGDALGYTDGGELGLYAGERLLSSVPIQGGGGEGGTTDHRFLSHRDAAGQHPIEAIDGLREEIQRIPAPVEALSNLELEELLK